MGDLPLRTPTDRCLGGPLPRQQANRTHPHPSPINLYSQRHAASRDHRVLILLSQGYPRAMGRLDTRYAPVRRSPSIRASSDHAAPRLACVKPVASVHPEPGSNSSLYYLFLFFFLQMKTTNNRAVRLPAIGYRTDGSILFPVLLLVYVNMSMNLFVSPFLETRMQRYGNFSN